jgi:hypothetical protein
MCCSVGSRYENILNLTLVGCVQLLSLCRAQHVFKSLWFLSCSGHFPLFVQPDVSLLLLYKPDTVPNLSYTISVQALPATLIKCSWLNNTVIFFYQQHKISLAKLQPYLFAFISRNKESIFRTFWTLQVIFNSLSICIHWQSRATHVNQLSFDENMVWTW